MPIFQISLLMIIGYQDFSIKILHTEIDGYVNAGDKLNTQEVIHIYTISSRSRKVLLSPFTQLSLFSRIVSPIQ